LSDLSEKLKSNDLLTKEALKSLTDTDLDELILALGDRVRFKKMLDSIKTNDSDAEKKTDEPMTPKKEAVDTLGAVNLAEESKKLLRQAALQGLSRATQMIASTQNSPGGQAAHTSVQGVEAEDEQSLTKKINRVYLFILSGWLTYGILVLVAWHLAHKANKNLRNEILSQHCRLQIKLCSVWIGVWFLGSIVAGVIDNPGFYQVYGIALLLTWVWYMVVAWKGRKALKEGKSPL